MTVRRGIDFLIGRRKCPKRSGIDFRLYESTYKMSCFPPNYGELNLTVRTPVDFDVIQGVNFNTIFRIKFA